jgi:hypothetical protein
MKPQSFEEFYSVQYVETHLRPVLQQRLMDSLECEDWQGASLYLSAFVDSWPVAGSMTRALKLWQDSLEPMALAILHRGKQIANTMGEDLDITLPQEVPPHLFLEGTKLTSQRAQLCQQAVRDELVAVFFVTDVPDDVESQLALGELRMEARCQRSAELYGIPGLLCEDALPWEQSLGRAPKGRLGLQYQKMCDLAILPGTPNRLKQQNPSPVGWLLWNGPAKPLPIAEVAVQIIRNISSGIEVASQAASIDPIQCQQIVEELVSIGALTAVQP